MANASTLNIKEQKARCRRQLEDTKVRIESEIKRYKSALRNLRIATSKYDAAYTRYVKRPNEAKYDAVETALSELNRIKAISDALRRRLTVYLETVDSLSATLGELSDVADARAMDFLARVNKYRAEVGERICDLEEPVISALPEDLAPADDDVDAFIDSIADDDEIAEDEPVPVEPSEPKIGLTSVTVAPISIDVTPIVERAIASAIDQLSVGLEEKLRAYIDTIPTPVQGDASNLTAATPVIAEASGEAAKLQIDISAKEADACEKLGAIYADLEQLSAGLAELSAGYATISERIKEISEAQRAINDMQRRTMREQQGIQAAQKVISDDQLELNAQQRFISEEQAKAKDATSALSASQASAIELGEEVAKTQAELTTSIEALLETSRSLLDSQRAIEERAAKVQQTQNAVAERQLELATRQKETLSAQRRLQKEQRTISARQPAPKGSTKRPDADDGE